MNKPRGLGRGLSELIRTPAAAATTPGESVHELDIGLIDPNPVQPRQSFDPAELADLANSIAAQGLLQPITVRQAPGGRFQLVAGERRLRATRDLGQTRIRAILREVSDRQLLELALVENLLRSDLNEIEVAESLRDLQQRYGYSAAQLAQVLGKSRPALSNTLRLLELPRSVQDMLRARQLAASHGRAVLAFPEEQREQIAQRALEGGWSVRELERRAAALAVPRKPKPSKTPRSAGTSQNYVKRAETRLMEHLGTKVSIADKGQTGTISISYHGADDLERMLGLLLAESDPL